MATNNNVNTSLSGQAGTGVFVGGTDGTFTPIFNVGGSNTGVTYTTQVGIYTRNGNSVTIELFLNILSIASLTGACTISGLPFATRNTSNAYTTLSMFGTVLTLTGSPQCYITPNTQIITLTQITTGTSSSISNTAIAPGSEFIITGTYLI